MKPNVQEFKFSLVIASVLVAAALLAGCQSPPAAVKTQPSVGMTKEQVTAQYGKPARVARSDEGEVWTYDNSALARIPFNYGYHYKEHRFIFDDQGLLAKFNVEDF